MMFQDHTMLTLRCTLSQAIKPFFLIWETWVRLEWADEQDNIKRVDSGKVFPRLVAPKLKKASHTKPLGLCQHSKKVRYKVGEHSVSVC